MRRFLFFELTPLANFAIAGIVLNLLLLLWMSVMDAGFLLSIANHVPDSIEDLLQEKGKDSVYANVSLVAAVVNILSSFLVLKWIYESNKFLQERELPDMRFEPAYSVLWFFVPVASFYLPYAAMQEIYTGTIALREKDKSAWQEYRKSAYLLAWWLFLWLPFAYQVSVMFRFSGSEQDAISFMIDNYWLSPVMAGLRIFEAVFLLLSIREIRNAQQEIIRMEQEA
jgi:hypothetical protein